MLVRRRCASCKVRAAGAAAAARVPPAQRHAAAAADIHVDEKVAPSAMVGLTEGERGDPRMLRGSTYDSKCSAGAHSIAWQQAHRSAHQVHASPLVGAVAAHAQHAALEEPLQEADPAQDRSRAAAAAPSPRQQLRSDSDVQQAALCRAQIKSSRHSRCRNVVPPRAPLPELQKPSQGSQFEHPKQCCNSADIAG